ncbi:DUF5977 domain-containing protein [Flavobacterium ajazii]|uniref:DUF5977 domain-containing protein n=1 Tax=Flavobacterium ajazii TaxID=2692318 RepID=UPI0013D6B8A3|nr:DUF5977 domain-containing protein [Flavobacterium ajazii]
MGKLNKENRHKTPMKQYALIFYIIILLINSQKVKSQEADALKSHIPNINVASPQAASISKVGEIPIDISTGRMNYTIPIFEIKEGDFSMPINLSYNYSGLLLDEAPGYAGVGWTFNIGGSILHSINGLDDTNREYQKEWVYKYVNKLPPYDDYISSSGLTTITQYLESVSNGVFDGEPDKYNVNAGNLNCSFYLDKDNNPIFLKNSNYKVSGYSYSGFTITDDKGVNYIFDIVQNTTKSLGAESSEYISSFLLREINFPTSTNKIIFEYDTVTDSYNDINVSQTLTLNSTQYLTNQSQLLNTNKTYTILDTNKLKKIITNDYTIELQYNNNSAEPGIAVISNLSVKDKSATTIKSYDFVYSGWTGKRTNLLNVAFNGQVINEMEYDMSTPYPVMADDSDYAKKDLWGYYNQNGRPATVGGTIDPDNNPQLKPDFASTKIGALTKVTYQTKGYSTIEYEPNFIYLNSGAYNFPYDADETATISAAAQTLVQDGITSEQTIVITKVPAKIELNYYVANQPDFQMPVGSEYQDQRYTKVLFLKDGDAETNSLFTYSKTWLPEGNWIPQTTSFSGTITDITISVPGTYRLKAISDIGSRARISISAEQLPDFITQTVGGLRVKQVKNCDFNGSCITTAYNYSQDGKSTGLMLQKPKFYSGYHIQNSLNCSPSIYVRRDFYNFTSVLPLSNFRGSPVVYKIVEKTDSGKDKNNLSVSNGKTIFYYHGEEVSNSLQDEQVYFTIGLLDKKIIKNENNTKVAKQQNDYINSLVPPNNDKFLYVLNSKIVRETRANFSGGGSSGSGCAMQYPRPLLDFQAAWFRYQPRNYMLQKEENINYYANDSIVQSTTFDYDLNLTLLKSKKVVNSKGETLETKYLYPTDSEMSGESFVSELISKNRIGTPLAVRSYNTNKLSDQKTVYAKDASTSNLLLPKYVYANKGADAIDSTKDKKVTYDQYDDKGNILQYTLESGMPVSIIWGYNKTQPVAKIENAVYSSIPVGTITNLQSLSDADNDNCVSASCKEQLFRNALDTFRATLPNAFISTYTYDPLIGVTSITDPRGNVSYYEYDALGRLQFVKDKDLNVLQKYCYNYKGQQIDCDINFASGTVYKSIARSGSFTRNNCASGEVGSSVTYNQAEGVETSIVSQADADSKGLTRFNTDGQAYANTNGTCSIPPPAAPTGLTFTSATASSLNFSWTAVSGATSYKIYKNGTDTGTTSATNTGSLSGLTASTTYSIQVMAVNASGNSTLSSAVSMTTASAPVSNTCTLNFERESGTSYMYKNGSSYLTRSTSGTSSGTLATGDTFYVMVSASSTYYKGIVISSSVRGVLYNTLIRTGSSVTSPTFTKTGSEVITINCTTATEP